jgi:hypothetical protein
MPAADAAEIRSGSRRGRKPITPYRMAVEALELGEYRTPPSRIAGGWRHRPEPRAAVTRTWNGRCDMARGPPLERDVRAGSGLAERGRACEHRDGKKRLPKMPSRWSTSGIPICRSVIRCVSMTTMLQGPFSPPGATTPLAVALQDQRSALRSFPQPTARAGVSYSSRVR